GKQLTDHGEPSAVERPQATEFPPALACRVIDHRTARQRLELLDGPFRSAEQVETARQVAPQGKQETHVVVGVLKLLWGKGAARPIGQRFGLSELDLEEQVHQGAVSERVAEADQPCGDLQVEEVTRRPATPELTKADLLPAGVDDHDSDRVGDQFPESIERA